MSTALSLANARIAELEKELATLRASLAEPVKGGGLSGVFGKWWAIDTAPKDGREVLLLVKSRAGIPWRCVVGHFMEGGHCIEDHPPIDRGWYYWNGGLFDRASEPTHWTPLPPPPESEPKGQATPVDAPKAESPCLTRPMEVE